MRFFFTRSFPLALLALLLLASPDLYSAHGVSIDGKLKYAKGFSRFDYVDPAAKSGGKLTLHDFGSFDKLNPYTLKGMAPLGLSLYVFETLAVPSMDEPFAEYGLIAQDIELAADKRSVTFTLDPRARFSDGSPVRPEDIQFSLETMKSEQAHPFYQLYFQDIESAEILDEQRIRFHFAKVNRELHMIACQLPVLSKDFYSKHPFNASGGGAMQPPLGSGPYVVSQVVAGKSITYQKNPDYWGKEHPTRRHMFNFDAITVKIFKDPVVSVEGFKAGEFDFMAVNIAKQWERDLQGRHFDSGKLVKKTFAHHNNMGLQGFVFNTRRPVFSDRKVRLALWTAFDFEWINRTLFSSHYTRNTSFFSNSDYAATGLPSPEELVLLEPFRDQLPEEVFTQALAPPPSTNPPGSLRANLQTAKELLREAGWEVKKGKLTNGQGEVFRFEILLDNANNSFERVFAPYIKNLNTLGIEASTRGVDQALYADRMKNFDFDMAVTVYGQSQSPGNEQRDFWSSGAAEQKGSRNLAGIRSPVVDALVDKVIYAQTQEELLVACRALDRVLWYGYYLVPNWYLDHYRLAYAARLKHPERLPLYYNPYQWLDAWWIEE